MAISSANNEFPNKQSTFSGLILVLIGLFTFAYSCIDVKVVYLFIGTLISCLLLSIVGVVITLTGLKILTSLMKSVNILLGLVLLSDILAIIAFCIFCNLAEYFGTFNDVINDEKKAALYIGIDLHFILSIVSVVCLLVGIILSLYLLFIINRYWQTTISFPASLAYQHFPTKYMIFSGLTTALVGLFTFIFSYVYSHWLFIGTLVICFTLTIIGVVITLTGLKILKLLVENTLPLMVLIIIADILAFASFGLFCYLADEYRGDTREYVHLHFTFCVISVLLLLLVAILLIVLIFAVNHYRKVARALKQKTSAINEGFSYDGSTNDMRYG